MTGYRLLLHAYPKGPRRAELLGTLTEGGRRTPTAREVANLLRWGMRARLGRPAGRGVVLLAVLVALVTAYLGGSLGDRLGWQFAPGFPAGAQLAGIERTIFPGVAVTAESDGDGLFNDMGRPSLGHVLLLGHNEDFAYSTLVTAPQPGTLPGDYRQWSVDTTARLAAAGWQVDDITPRGATDTATGTLEQDGTGFTASRGALSVYLETYGNPLDVPAGNFRVTAAITRHAPPAVIVLGWLGWLLGALIGWLLTGWASRRTEWAGATVRALTKAPVIAALTGTLPLALLGTTGLVAQDLGLTALDRPFWSLSVTWFYGLTQLAALLGLGALLVAGIGGRELADPVEAAPPAG